MVLIAIISVIALPYIGISTFSMNRGLYNVKVTNSPLDAILVSDGRFKLIHNGTSDLEISSSSIQLSRTERSLAALSAVDETIKEYSNYQLKNQYQKDSLEYYSAFPVWIDVTYLDSSLQIVSEETIVTSIPTATQEQNISSNLTPEIAPGPGVNVSGTSPRDIRPPFPFMSIMVSFLFVVPMFFISQLYSSSIMDERISRKGIMLLASPIRGYELVIGKTLPYFIILLVFTVIATLVLGGGFLVVLIMLPVILIFLSTAFVSSITARNFRELTMFLVFFSIVLGSYLFIPTAFVNIHEYSIISPLTLVVNQLEGEVITNKGMIFASAPLLFVSLLAFLFGTLLMNEEGLLVKVEVLEKILDSIERLMHYLGDWRFGVIAIGTLLVPFVFMTQLFLLVIFFNIMNISPILVIGISMAVSVVVEEWTKALAPIVLIRKGYNNHTLLGILSGTGYFLGEKGLLLLALASIVQGGLGQVLFVGAGYLLVIPLGIHVMGAVISAKGIASGWSPKRAVLAASVLHFFINLVIIWRGGIFG
ncbi:MAG: hypothetical protein E4G94_07820 [ANME-2 cluster archaeon]|nr:MAG: hypothetical protein E4G94_07820 [ANME-2 cluster archaeon]